MREQRRVEDSCRESQYRHGEPASERRSAFADQSKDQRTADLGVKIKGQASVNRASQSPSRSDYPVERERSHRDVARKSYPSPHRSYNRERPLKRSGKLGDKSSGSRRHFRSESKISPTRRRRSSSNSPYRELSSHRFARKRSISPGRRVISSRTDRSTSRNRDRNYSPSKPSKAEHYSFHQDKVSNSTTTVAGDSYIPSAKRYRARSPASNSNRPSSSTRRGFLSSREIPQSDHKPPVHNYQRSTREWASRKERGSRTTKYRRDSRSRDRSPPRYQDTRRRRREHRSSSPAESKRKRKHSRSPINSERAPSERSRMQSSTRPIQSILDEGSRPPSPPRPIPSFDSDSHDSGGGGLRETFTMHSIKASEMHGSIRSGRSQHIDTRQPYSASPQWTPTSSHHGSPQSGSPFSHGRGAWSGPSQHFHGQQRLVLATDLPFHSANCIATTSTPIRPRFARMDSLHKPAPKASFTHIPSRTNTITSSSRYKATSRIQLSEEVTQVIEATISINHKTVASQVQDLQITGSIPQGAEAGTSKTSSGPLVVAVEGEANQIQVMVRTIHRDTLKAPRHYNSNSRMTPQLHLQTRMAITRFAHRRIYRLKIRAAKTRTYSVGFLLGVRRCYPRRVKLRATTKARRVPKSASRSRIKVHLWWPPSLFRI